MTVTRNLTTLRRMLIMFAAIATLGVSATTANAGVVPISFTTVGTFSAGTPADLAYTPISFTGATAPDGTLTLTDIGQFSLSSSSQAEHFTQDSFTLQFNFLTPVGVIEPVEFIASLSGQINPNGNGNVHVHFKPNEEVISFSNQTGSGSFTLTVNNVIGLRQQGTVTATGSVYEAGDYASAVPEPGSFILLGSALIALSCGIRRGFRK